MLISLESRRIDPDILVIEAGGRMTLGNELAAVEGRMKQWIAATPAKLILDVSKLSYVDSAGIGVLVNIAGSAMKAGAATRIAGVAGRVATLFEVTNLGRVIPLFPDIASALGSFSAPQP